jgi:Fe-Mn family superoxide dismutase
MMKHPAPFLLGRRIAAFFGVLAFTLATGTTHAATPDGPYTLPALPYAYDALEPHIDAETMRIHHNKHHQAYVTNANKLLVDQPELARMSPAELLLNLDKAPESLRTGLLDNVGGHLNHSEFWLMMSPDGGGEPSGDLAVAIEKAFGSFAEFKSRFTEAAMKRFGSGWAWLVVKDGKLAIVSTPNQNPPLINGETAILGLDVWEHAYYLKYQNRRIDYAESWWNVVNWPEVARRYTAAMAQ